MSWAAPSRVAARRSRRRGAARPGAFRIEREKWKPANSRLKRVSASATEPRLCLRRPPGVAGEAFIERFHSGDIL